MVSLAQCLVRQDEGPPHAAITAGELEGQVEPQLDEHVTARQAREAPVHAVYVCEYSVSGTYAVSSQVQVVQVVHAAPEHVQDVHVHVLVCKKQVV